ncbi:MAG TPA: ubiquinol-cytochrome c reductase iron-sulfur subunit [Permianibacter sp.]|nr:ubiquinol-cytochrome c reductase iron-sulfur subunit [Permianibacter sp.]
MAEQKDGVDLGRRRVLTWATAAVGAVGAGFVAVPFIKSWMPSAKAQAAGAPVEVPNINKLLEGEGMTVMWRGQPVMVVRRSQASIDSLAGLATELRDPNSEVVEQQPSYAQNGTRSIKPEYLVVINQCTHLGCSPTFKPQVEADWAGGFYCPCHGSKFDMAGRVYQGVPAPTNLRIPPHMYTGENTLVIGVDEQGAA